MCLQFSIQAERACAAARMNSGRHLRKVRYWLFRIWEGPIWKLSAAADQSFFSLVLEDRFAPPPPTLTLPMDALPSTSCCASTHARARPVQPSASTWPLHRCNSLHSMQLLDDLERALDPRTTWLQPAPAAPAIGFPLAARPCLIPSAFHPLPRPQ